MKKVVFELPADPDKRLAVAAMLTSAVCNMDLPKEEAMKRVCEVYKEILNGSQDKASSLHMWEDLSEN